MAWGIWRPLRDPKFGLMNGLSDSITRVEASYPDLLPDLRSARALIVASDYGGQHKGSRFQSYSFVLTDGGNWAEWETSRAKLRRRYRLGDRRFAFKGLGDRRKSGALPAFLSAADVLNGLCATVLVDRSIESLFVKQGRLDLSRPEAQAYAGYGVDTFERLLRTVHFLSFFLGGLSAAGQDVLWITDQDEIAANAERLTDLTSIVAHILGHYAPHDWGHLPCATTASDNGTLETEDLTAIADLTAGALAEMATAHADQGTFPGGAVIAPPPARLSRKARTVIEWFSIPGMPLRRLACAITSVQGSSKLTATVLRFHWGPALSSLGFE